jgi:hypothetical protein
MGQPGTDNKTPTQKHNNPTTKMGKAARAHIFEQCFYGQKSAHQHKLPIEFKAINIPRGFSNISQPWK